MPPSISTPRLRCCELDARPGRAPFETEEQLLASCLGGDLAAREELVHRFLPLAQRLAAHYVRTGESREDLEQVACVGLIKAIDRYDAELGSFVAYAVPNILGELKRHLRDKGWSMRVPRPLQERVLHVNKAIERLSAQLRRSPTPGDIAAHTGLAIDDVVEALEAAPSSRCDSSTTSRSGRSPSASGCRRCRSHACSGYVGCRCRPRSRFWTPTRVAPQ